ncbi:MAG: hypothetical protein Q620_VSAC00966G0001, partial [Veillonella sp. DORA_A_3_16_22]
MPKLISELPQLPISGIGVSGFPRREENSYMPAFMVGLGYGQSLSHMMNVPLHVFAHQENHILAALRELKTIPKDPFLALHLSGGTTELVYCHYKGEGIFESPIAGWSALAAEQTQAVTLRCWRPLRLTERFWFLADNRNRHQ